MGKVVVIHERACEPLDRARLAAIRPSGVYRVTISRYGTANGAKEDRDEITHPGSDGRRPSPTDPRASRAPERIYDPTDSRYGAITSPDPPRIVDPSDPACGQRAT
jgi:hypothetical protein